MVSTRAPRIARPIGIVVVLAAALAATVIKPFGAKVTEPVKAPGYVCPHAGSQWGSVSEAEYEQALTCLVNRQRTRRGLRSLTVHSRLALAAERHATDMDRREYFAHTSPSGSTPESRARASDYLPGEGRWKVGEDLAWGRGPDSTPSEIVADWMASRTHRAQILTSRYRNFGAGTEGGSPGAGSESGAVTIAAGFGYR